MFIIVMIIVVLKFGSAAAVMCRASKILEGFFFWCNKHLLTWRLVHLDFFMHLVSPMLG